MHDVLSLERLGVPAVAVLSDCFPAQGIFQAAGLGVPVAVSERLIVLAKHPISNATPTEIARKADGVFEDLVHALTCDKPPAAALRRQLRASGEAKAEASACDEGG